MIPSRKNTSNWKDSQSVHFWHFGPQISVAEDYPVHCMMCSSTCALYPLDDSTLSQHFSVTEPKMSPGGQTSDLKEGKELTFRVLNILDIYMSKHK